MLWAGAICGTALCAATALSQTESGGATQATYNPFIPALARVPGAYEVISNILATPAPEPFIPEVAIPPSGSPGTYFILGRNTPPLPRNTYPGLPCVLLDPTNRIYLLDGRGVDWAGLAQARQSQMRSLLTTADTPLDLPGNQPASPLDLNQTGLLYLQIPRGGLDDTNLTVVLINSFEGEAYTILTKEDLTAAAWTEEQLVYGAPGDATTVQLARNSRTNLFVWARTGVPASALAIVTQPLSQDVCDGDTVTFSVVAMGGGTLNYQLSFNGTNIDGATGTSYTIDTVMLSDAGSYAVTVTNGAASVSSQTAQLTVEGGTGDPSFMFLFGARQDYTFKPSMTYYIGLFGPVEMYGTTKLLARLFHDVRQEGAARALISEGNSHVRWCGMPTTVCRNQL